MDSKDFAMDSSEDDKDSNEIDSQFCIFGGNISKNDSVFCKDVKMFNGFVGEPFLYLKG